jgi:Family of unknown function (DUF5908)
MPVQINEMQIKANISEAAQKGTESHPDAHVEAADKEEIIKECTDIIIEWLSRKNER